MERLDREQYRRDRRDHQWGIRRIKSPRKWGTHLAGQQETVLALSTPGETAARFRVV